MSAGPLRVAIEGEPSYVTIPVHGGASLCIHVLVKPSGALDVLRVAEGTDGKLQMERYETTRKALRGDLKLLASRYKAKAVPMPGGHVASRIRQRVAAHLEAGGTLSAKDRAALAPIEGAQPSAHPTDEWPRTPSATLSATHAAAMIEEPEATRWIPDAAVSKAMEHAMVASGDEGADDGTRAERAIDEAFDLAARRSLAETLRDLAVVFGATGRVNRAMDALAYADLIESVGPEAPRPSEVPLMPLLIYRLALVQQALAKRNPQG